MALINMVQSLNKTLEELMGKDERVIVLGEDVGRDGGVFRVTDNLLNKYGDERVIDTPLNELAIVGMAAGHGYVRPKADRRGSIPGLHISGIRPDCEQHCKDEVQDRWQV